HPAAGRSHRAAAGRQLRHRPAQGHLALLADRRQRADERRQEHRLRRLSADGRVRAGGRHLFRHELPAVALRPLHGSAHEPRPMTVERSLFVGDPTPRCYPFSTMPDIAMPDQLADISRWIAERALAGEAEARVLAGACEGMAQLGIGLRRATMGADTLHPVLLGRWFEWHRDRDDVKETEYARIAATKSDELWRNSPFHDLYNTGQSRLRRRLTSAANAPPDYPILSELAADGMTDYVAYCHRLGGTAVVGAMDCIFSSWTSDSPDGFSDEHLDALDRIVPCIASAIVGISLGRIAGTLVETYLGRDAGRRVLGGSIERGVAEHIRAVLWFSDLKGFTRLVDSVAPGLIMP